MAAAVLLSLCDGPQVVMAVLGVVDSSGVNDCSVNNDSHVARNQSHTQKQRDRISIRSCLSDKHPSKR